MGRIVLSGPQNVTLDGVVQDPDGAEGFERGGWFKEFGGADLDEWAAVALDEALAAEAWLLGRRSYEFFGSRWRSRTGALADRLNSLPKFVVSSTLTDPGR
jgi:dihydrofolate reductase